METEAADTEGTSEMIFTDEDRDDYERTESGPDRCRFGHVKRIGLRQSRWVKGF